jgi:hypothetical protein
MCAPTGRSPRGNAEDTPLELVACGIEPHLLADYGARVSVFGPEDANTAADQGVGVVEDQNLRVSDLVIPCDDRVGDAASVHDLPLRSLHEGISRLREHSPMTPDAAVYSTPCKNARTRRSSSAAAVSS